MTGLNASQGIVKPCPGSVAGDEPLGSKVQLWRLVQ